MPDYTAAAMAAQQRELAAYQRRLAAIDPSGWPVRQQVDWHIVRAEMNGLDFDHRVLRPWANNPAFYVTVFTGAERSAGARGAFRVRRGRALELRVSARTPSAPARLDAGIRADPEAARAGEAQPGRRQGRSLDVRHARASSSRAPTCERLAPRVAGAPGTLEGRRRSARRRRPTRSRVARRAGAVEARAVGRRRRELQLVSEERAAGAVHVAGRGHDHGARAGARARVPRARGAAQRGAAACRRRSRTPTTSTAQFNDAVDAVHDVPQGPRRS